MYTMIGEAAKAIQESGGKHVGVFEARAACARGSPYGRFRSRFSGPLFGPLSEPLSAGSGLPMGRHAALQHPALQHPAATVADAAASPPCPRAEAPPFCSPPFLTPALFDPRLFTRTRCPTPQAKIIMAGRVLIILTIIAVSALLIYQVRHASSALGE